MEPNAARFPFPLPPRTIGEEKAKVKHLSHFSYSSPKLPLIFSAGSPPQVTPRTDALSLPTIFDLS
jgi:hypothetical protein